MKSWKGRKKKRIVYYPSVINKLTNLILFQKVMWLKNFLIRVVVPKFFDENINFFYETFMYNFLNAGHTVATFIRHRFWFTFLRHFYASFTGLGMKFTSIVSPKKNYNLFFWSQIQDVKISIFEFSWIILANFLHKFLIFSWIFSFKTVMANIFY